MQIFLENPKIKSADLTSLDLVGSIETFVSPVMAAFVAFFVFHSYAKVPELTAFYLSIIAFILFKKNGLRIDKSFWGNITSSFITLIRVICIGIAVTWFVLDVPLEDSFLIRPNLLFHELRHVLIWLGITLLMQMLGIQALKFLAHLRFTRRKVVFVGVDTQTCTIANSLMNSPYSGSQILGFFDDRAPERRTGEINMTFLGKTENLSKYVNAHKVDSVYISLPMSRQKRMLSLIQSLKDTTANVHFIPDMFITELIQARVVMINGALAISVCETPFIGIDGAIKRISDIILSTIIVLLISPIMLIISLIIKLESSGPIIFKQSRYGLNGEEIIVYKFRSMNNLDNGPYIKQAEKNDSRLTRIGGFLRRTSLDELPQFINVLQGRMSIVGPRPHALAHNEEYRKIINGYMLRHLARPGITGLAQINGFRGETRDSEMMKKRVEFDIQYLQNWTIWLDLKIIFQTVFVVLRRDGNAY